jgi:hypothetical protein
LSELYAVLAGGAGDDVPVPVRAIAAAAGASPSSVGSTIDRLRHLGLIDLSGGGEWIPQPNGRPGSRTPHRYRPHWPPTS